MPALAAGMDFRQPDLRPAVFLKWFAFQVRHRSHPGGVYYLIPWLRDHYSMTDEELHWFAFINGQTQNPITTWLLWKDHRDPRAAGPLVDKWRAEYPRLAFDTDRRHHKVHLDASVEGYLTMLGGRPQRQFWEDTAAGGWQAVWTAASSIPYFGRLSAWSYCDYLHIAGVNVDCDTLMLADRDGSKSHRNGLAKVSGHDEWDWHASNPGFDGVYSPEVTGYLGEVGYYLLATTKSAFENQPYDLQRDVTYLTLESALCTYKSWFRENRRYPNVYNDMMYDRIRAAEAKWTEEDFSQFWQARADSLPAHLRLEDNPTDPGMSRTKQNWFRETGQVIMMTRDYPVFANDFEAGVAEGRWGVFR